MAGKTDKTKLASAILNVGTSRITGVEKGATVNGGSGKVEHPTEKPQEGVGVPDVVQGGVGRADSPAVASDAASAADPADAKTDRIAFMCSPKEKKHLKQLALDRDTNVSVLIREALEAKGWLP